MPLPSRRQFLRTGTGLLAATAVARAEPMQPWTPGTLDIHHISTGRGSSAFLLCPDGTTMLVDCGATSPSPATVPYLCDPKPDASRRPGQWIARYVQRHMAAARRSEIDAFLLTHFHDDHMGKFTPDLPTSKFGNYRLTGIADLAETVPIRKILDRGWPDYNYPAPLQDPHAANYIAFARTPARTPGRTVERFVPGRRSQMALNFRFADFPSFEIRNIAANGEVWTGVGETTRRHFPALSALTPAQYPTENMCSAAIRLSYGAFDYFTGGDLSNDTNYNRDPWRDIETPVARAAGPVDVAVANHHGYQDAVGPEFVAALRPRAFVINGWDSSHPSGTAIANMLSRDLYPGDRDVYSTAVKPESKIAIRRLAELKSGNGHVILRVPPPGTHFQVFITTNDDESDRVLATFGPFLCT
jgi:hypothetical protein